MDLRRPRAGDWAMAAAGAALLASLFLPWYRKALACVTAPCPADRVTGWEALAVIDGALAVAALLGLAALAATAMQPTDAVPIALTALAGLAGVIAAVLATLRLVDLPGSVEVAATASTAPGAWLALAAALGLAGAAIAAMRDERPRGAAADPSIDVRAAPATGGGGAPTYNRRR